ncbi:hypothetical protein ACJX0J_026670 [Zea mays]
MFFYYYHVIGIKNYIIVVVYIMQMRYAVAACFRSSFSLILDMLYIRMLVSGCLSMYRMNYAIFHNITSPYLTNNKNYKTIIADLSGFLFFQHQSTFFITTIKKRQITFDFIL